MGKRKYTITEQKMKQKIKNGDGKGEGANYKPWISIHDLPSLGKVRRIRGWKTNRVHHFLSQLESDYFCILEWSDNVLDIREQFPLELLNTLEIARENGLNHPVDNRSKFPIIMTTDFLITYKTNVFDTKLIARTVKYEKDLTDRVWEKFKIERLYWENNNVEWGVITERSLNYALIENVKWIHKYKDITGYNLNLSLNDINYTNKIMRAYILENEQYLTDSTQQVDKMLGLKAGTSLILAKHLIANKIWNVNMDSPLWKQSKFAINQV